MSYNGSGQFNLVAGNPFVTATTISSTTMNSTLSDIATGLSTAVTKDGQTTPTANIPMGGFKLTGLGAATVAGDALRFENIALLGSSIQNQTYVAFTTGGTSTAYTLTPTPAITAYTANQSFYVNFNAASGAAPTLAISAVATPPNLVKQIGDGTYANIAANDIPINHRSRVTLLSATQALVEDLPMPSATQAQQETGTDVVNPVTPGRQQFHPSAAKAWVLATPAGVATVSYNVSSITDIGTGSIGVNFTTAFSSANYCRLVSVAENQMFHPGIDAGGTISASRCDFINYDGAGTPTDPAGASPWAMAFYGDQ